MKFPRIEAFENVIRRLGDGELVGRSRVDDAHLAEREKCAQVCDRYRQELSAWTAKDDHGESIETQRAVATVLLEAARRIRARGDAPEHGAARPRKNSARAAKRT